MAHAMRAIAQLRAVRGPGALSTSPSFTAARARTIPAAIRTFSLAHNRPSHPSFTSPVSSTPLRPRTKLSQHKLNLTSQPSKRSFSVVSYFDSAINLTHDYLLFLHSSLGIPWYLTIPLFAISLNLLVRLPARLYIHDIAQRRAKLQPLSHAFRIHNVSQQDREKNNKLPENLKMIPELTAKSHQRFEKRWKLQTWRVFTAQLSSFPLWLLGIEALRRESTSTGGLLGIILNWFREKNLTGEVDPVELANSAIKRTPPLDNPVLTEAAGQVDTVSTAISTASPAMEGIFWIPDLALSDPYHILPLTLSAVLVANAMPKDRNQWGKLLGTIPLDEDKNRLPQGVQFKRRLMLTGTRLNLLFSVAVGPLTMGLPAAMHLYWITTTLVAPILAKIVNLWRPLHRWEPLRTRMESHMIYPMPPQERKEPVVAAEPPAAAARPAAAVQTKRPASTAKSTATTPASSPAKPTSRFAAQGGKKKTANR
ncbi:hypothetical protein QBC40DRAFT_276156 [Triangularia verruculosa]|uniref:Uncharacterized protein n=1 Tax=Triangularia verruculosa TaxID=2587418 RepID=A0AAN6XMZ9_9PEZI|nr:hypothetical protein QBC40DRAFT_276156 [Triangularia verruculosa]